MVPTLAAAIAGSVAALAWAAGTLTARGALAAWSVGFLVLAGTGWAGGAVLAAFFVSSSAVSRLARIPAGLDPKGNRRDALQVYANGGVAAMAALGGLTGVMAGDTAFALVTCALAAAAADTWASSIGSRSRHPPRDLLTGRTVPAGTSGGVSWAGTAGGLAGAAVVGGVAALTGHSALLPAATIIGVTGMLADSALGATVQGRFRCPHCSEASEWPRHRCGAPTTLTGGWRWLSNDGVNAIATACAAVAAWLAWH